MKPNYIAKTSLWSRYSFGKTLLWFLMLVLIVPLWLFGWDLLVVKMDLAAVFFALFAILLLVPAIWIFCDILIVKNRYIEFYKDKIIQHWGVLNKQERQAVFMGVTSTTMKRPFWGRIFGYGHVYIDCAGKWDFDARFVKNPYRLVRYLRTKSIKTEKAGKIVEV